MSYGMPDQASDAIGMGLRAARLARLIVVLLVAGILTLLVVLSHDLSIATGIILLMIWLLAVGVGTSGGKRKGTDSSKDEKLRPSSTQQSIPTEPSYPPGLRCVR